MKAGLFGGLWGIALSAVGFTFVTWQFWLLYVLFLVSYFYGNEA